MRSCYFVLFVMLAIALSAVSNEAHVFGNRNTTVLNHTMLGLDPQTRQDSIAVDPALEFMQIMRYEQYRQNKFKLIIPDINPFTLKYSLDFIDYKQFTESDLYLISNELYEKYYKNDVLLWNFKDSAYLNLNLSALQSSRGLIQLDIPLSNFPTLFNVELKRLIQGDMYTH